MQFYIEDMITNNLFQFEFIKETISSNVEHDTPFCISNKDVGYFTFVIDNVSLIFNFSLASWPLYVCGGVSYTSLETISIYFINVI